MKVQEIMTAKVESIKSTATLRQAARTMKDLNIGSLLIIEDDQLLGIITDRDISCFAIAMGHDLNSTPVSKVMTREVTTCFDDADISEAARLMEDQKVRRLAVLRHDNSMAGFLSVDDLARYSHELAGEVLKAAGSAH
ncbi:MAG: CBS domain-containing protein [Gammaproteobacteria bacterium]|nr:CBS domain-containing protein [Gammaproteobacteria bacterium]